MQLVVADTGPINYLILIGHIDLLPALFEVVLLPTAVHGELTSPKTPALIRHWIAAPPSWLEVRDVPAALLPDTTLDNIDAGERAAIQLAAALHVDLLLIDDRKGVKAAKRKGLRVTGTLGILDLAAERGLVDFLPLWRSPPLHPPTSSAIPPQASAASSWSRANTSANTAPCPWRRQAQPPLSLLVRLPEHRGTRIDFMRLI